MKRIPAGSPSRAMTLSAGGMELSKSSRFEEGGSVVADVRLRFDPQSGELTTAGRTQIEHWVRQWLLLYPCAVVVMGGNDQARNHSRCVRERRLLELHSLLVSLGVPEERVRYTDDVVSTDVGYEPCTTPRGAIRLRVIRSFAADCAVVSIRELFAHAG